MENRTGCVYKLDFADGRSYIGASLQHVENRYCAHRNQARKGSNRPVHVAWLKYGDPLLVILEKDVVRRDLWLTEQKAIWKYGTLVPYGYNVDPGRATPPGMLGKTYTQSEEARHAISCANCGKKSSDESKEKNRQAHLGKKRSEESKQKQSRSTRGRPSYVRTEEIREKIRQSLLGRKASPETKKKQSLAHKGVSNGLRTLKQRENNRQAQLKRFSVPEEIGKLRANALRLWQDPKYREKCQLAQVRRRARERASSVGV